MISYNTRNGSVNLSNEYFSELIGNAVSTCYGVAAMKPHGLKKYINKVIYHLNDEARYRGSRNFLLLFSCPIQAGNCSYNQKGAGGILKY